MNYLSDWCGRICMDFPYQKNYLKKNQVIGIDNLNSYYSKNLKLKG